jgi:hypothetical protein
VGEFSTDSVSVDILEVGENESVKIIRTIPIDSPKYKGHIEDISFNLIDKKHIALSLDIEMKGMYGIKMRDIFLISMNGKVEPISIASGKAF